MGKSKKPSGLSIARSFNSFTCSWKHGEKYEKQAFHWRRTINDKNKKWNDDSIGKNKTSHKLSIDADDYFPCTDKKLTAISFSVKGKANKKSYSNWAGEKKKHFKRMFIEAPKPPKVGYAQQDAYSTTFVYELDKHVNDRKWWATYVEFQTVLTIDTTYKDASKIKSGWTYVENSQVVGNRNRRKIRDIINKTDETSYEIPFTESSANQVLIEQAISEGKNAIRWFRARVCGPGGWSKWVDKHVTYSEPKPAYNVRSQINDNGRGGYSCRVEWNYRNPLSFPIDVMKIQYAIAVPNEDIKPTNPSPQDAAIGGDNTMVPKPGEGYNSDVSLGASGIGKALVDFEIPEHVDLDQMVFVRVNAEHNGQITHGEWVYCEDNDGWIPNSWKMLKPPSELSIEDGSDNRITVITNNNSEVANVCIAVLFMTDDEQTQNVEYPVIGIIDAHNETGELSQVIEIPPDYVEGGYQIGVKAFVKDSSLTYYTLVATAVTNPKEEKLKDYYEQVSRSGLDPYYVITEDEELKQYYVVTATAVTDPQEEDLRIYYELNDGIYDLTGDDEIEPGKTYYTVEGTLVDNPVIADIGTYYEYVRAITDDNDDIIAILYEHTEDVILHGKIYYTVVATEVTNPTEEHLYEYYNYKRIFSNNSVDINNRTYIKSYYKLTTDEILYGEDSQRVISGNLGYNIYKLNDTLMESKVFTTGGTVIQPPSDITLENLGDGNVRVNWEWDWTQVDEAEIAWSDFKDALISTEPPSSYTVSNSQSSSLVVKGLELGVKWYFWIRLHKNGTPTAWSSAESIDLTSEPNISAISLSKEYVTLDDKFSANWTYVTSDNTEQSSATLCLCNVDENGKIVPYGNPIVVDGATQYITLDPRSEELNFEVGNTYHITVKVKSTSNQESEDWAPPASIMVVEPITCYISQSSLTPSATDYNSETAYATGDYAIKVVTDPEDDSQQSRMLMKCITGTTGGEDWTEDHWTVDENHPYQELHELSKDNPLELTVVASTLEIKRGSVMISRAMDYFVDRPDNGIYGGYQGEIVYQETFDTLDNISIDLDEINANSSLDDDAFYYLTVNITDNYDQSCSASYPFQVKWDHQAVMPIATVTIDDVAKITILPPSGAAEGDYCDIYRMTAEGIDLVLDHADFGYVYVDPYPTIGDQGGYRVVYRTYNGDYITSPEDENSNGSFAWLNFLPEDGYIFNSVSNLIDFGNNTLEIKYNVDMDNSWKKDFQTTKYLGGSIQGDYNAGVERTASLSTDIQTNDAETIRLIKELAVYEGLCHVRTKDGSNYLANVEVSENVPYQPYYDRDDNFTKLGSYSFSITRVDPEETDGITLSEWIEDQPSGETGSTGE